MISTSTVHSSLCVQVSNSLMVNFFVLSFCFELTQKKSDFEIQSWKIKKLEDKRVKIRKNTKIVCKVVATIIRELKNKFKSRVVHISFSSLYYWSVCVCVCKLTGAARWSNEKNFCLHSFQIRAKWKKTCKILNQNASRDLEECKWIQVTRFQTYENVCVCVCSTSPSIARIDQEVLSDILLLYSKFDSQFDWTWDRRNLYVKQIE